MIRTCACLALAFATALLCSNSARCDESAKYPLENSQIWAAGVPIRLIRVNLDDSRVKVSAQVARGCPSNDEAFDDLLSRSKPDVAINGTYFSKDTLKPIGDIVADGKLVTAGLMGTALAITPDNRALIRRVTRNHAEDWSRFKTVMACGPALVLNGKIDVDPAGEGFSDPHIMGSVKRMGVGLLDERHLMIVTTLEPVDFPKWAQVMKALGCKDAMNLDAGASLAMHFRGKTLIPAGRKLTNLLTVHVGAAKETAGNAALTPSQTDMALAERMLTDINAERKKVNASPLKLEPRLMAAANEHAKDMARNNRLSHTDEKGRDPWDRIVAKGYDYSACAENIAGAGTRAEPSKVVSMWMGSPDHQKNMLNPEYKDAGIARAIGDKGMSYWILVLGLSTSDAPKTANPDDNP